MQNNEIEPLNIITKINSKMDQKYKHKTKYHIISRRKYRKNLINVLDEDFFNTTPKAETSKAKINKWDHIKSKTLRKTLLTK